MEQKQKKITITMQNIALALKQITLIISEK